MCNVCPICRTQLHSIKTKDKEDTIRRRVRVLPFSTVFSDDGHGGFEMITEVTVIELQDPADQPVDIGWTGLTLAHIIHTVFGDDEPENGVISWLLTRIMVIDVIHC